MIGLILHERGRVLRDHPQEITRWRPVRKWFDIPAGSQPAIGATLWLLLAGPRDPVELRLGWDGRPLTVMPADSPPGWRWCAIDVAADVCGPGRHVLQLESSNIAMSGWAVALAPQPAGEHSEVSSDGGATWRAHGKAYHAGLQGEFVVRLRLHDEDDRVPEVVYEQSESAAVAALREMAPLTIRTQPDPWQQALDLRHWLAAQWVHHAGEAVYAPWEPATIMDWSHRGDRAWDRPVTAMCVHFGAAFVALAAALGHVARCAAVADALNSPNGHFVAEVFDAARQQWVLHDPNLDLHYELDGRPLALVDLADRVRQGLDCTRLAQTGPAFDSLPPHLHRLTGEFLLTGRSYRHVALWRRNDFISDPSAAALSHGDLCFNETDLIWYTPDAQARAEVAMFPGRQSQRRWFTQAPSLFAQSRDKA
jgi:hypothetical protein